MTDVRRPSLRVNIEVARLARDLRKATSVYEAGIVVS